MLVAFGLGKASAQSSGEVKKASAASVETGDPTSETTPVSTISVKVKVVNVLATVRDKHGQVVPNLTQSDFTLEEDGKPQTIRYFAHETDLPLTLGLLVDTSLSQRRVLDQERSASRSFVTRMVVSRPTTSTSFFCRRTCNVHALSLPLLQESRTLGFK